MLTRPNFSSLDPEENALFKVTQTFVVRHWVLTFFWATVVESSRDLQIVACLFE